MSEKQRVICVGSAGKDIFFPMDAGIVSANDHPEIATTDKWCFGYGAKVHVEDRFEVPGGCACNVSVGLARLGVDAAAYGVVGGDSDGVWIREQLAHDGVDVTHLRTLEGQKTDLSAVLVKQTEGERTIIVNRDVSEHVMFDCEVLKKYEWVYMSSVYGHAVEENMQKLHDLICKENLKLAYNPGMRNIRNNSDLVCDLIHHAALVFVNKTEAQMIVAAIDSDSHPQYNDDTAGSIEKSEVTDEIDLLAALSAHADDRATIVLTDGQRGAWVQTDGSVTHVAAIDAARIDTTGAGDAFASGYLGAMIDGQTPDAALMWGSANSHEVIKYYGAHKGLLTVDDVKGRAMQFSSSVVAKK